MTILPARLHSASPHRIVSSRMLLLVRILAPIVLLTGLVFAIDLREALDMIAHASFPAILAGLALVEVQIGLAALRWRLTAQSLGQRLGIGRAVMEYYGASLLNLILPGGVSGDLLRVARNRGTRTGAAGWERSAHAVFLERASGQIAFALVAASGIGWWLVGAAETIPAPAMDGLFVALSAILLGAASIAFAVFRLRGRIGRAAGRLWDAIGLAFLTPKAAAGQFLLSLAIVFCHLTVFALASRAVGAPLGIEAVLLVVPPVLLTMVLPISVGGWGVRETAAAALWPMVGFSPSAGVAASVLYGLISTVGALPGIFAFDVPLPRRIFDRLGTGGAPQAGTADADRRA